MQLTLTPDIENALKTQARQRGTTPEQLALATLHKTFVRPAQADEPSARQESLEESLADFLGNCIGVLHSSEYVPGDARMSENSGNRFARLIVKKREEGRL